MYAFDDVGLLCGASPTDGVLDDSLHVFILVGGIGFVSGLEIEDLAVAAGERTTAAEDLAAVEPADENDLVGIRIVERLPVHFLIFKEKTVFHAFSDRMIGLYFPDAFTGIVAPFEVTGRAH